ncbi:WecB/TagA/CpsF family glycosyltransferase [Patescibacteria group bacterium]|nr:WecB/TagA/CpsF family glycosyltransferase [Patescibacteria group bacterium]
MNRVYLADLPVDYLSLKTVSPRLIRLAESKRKKPYLVTYLNAHNFNLASKNNTYKEILKKADLVYADGWGVVWAARLSGSQLPGRLTTKDFFEGFCRMAEKEKLSLFFLGGKEKVVNKMVKILKDKFPQIKIKGWQNGYFNGKEEKRISARINQLSPDFLIVGMGSPTQELWLAKNLSQLKIKVGWCVGGLFDFISEEKPRCPKWLGDLGFEWLFRLLTEPKRLWRRYLIGGPEFLSRVIRLKSRQAR